MEIKAHLVYFSLGSNLGDRLDNLINAIKEIKSAIGEVTQVSSVYESPSWGYQSENNYLNCCIEVFTSLTPFQLLNVSQEIEKKMGRIKTEAYSDRIVDIDILRYDDMVIQDKILTIPHPHMHERAFVFVPLLEIIATKYRDEIEMNINKKQVQKIKVFHKIDLDTI